VPGVGYPAELLVLFGKPVNKRPEANALNKSFDINLYVFFNRRYTVLYMKVGCFMSSLIS